MRPVHVGEAGVCAAIGVGLLTKSGVLEILGGVFLVAALVLILLPPLTSRRPRLPKISTTLEPPPPVPGQHKSGQTLVSGDNLKVVVTPTPAHATAQAYPPTVSVGPDNSAIVRTLHGLREQGRGILADVSAAGAVVSRLTADKAGRWLQEVRLELDQDQREHFDRAGTFWSSTPSALMDSLKDRIRALDEIINDLCAVPEPVLSPNAEWYRRKLGP